MPDFKMVSPLLDHYSLEKEISTSAGRSSYSVRHVQTGECFIVKHLSIPASDSQVRALILSGIYSSDADVQAYYTDVVTEMKKELELGKKLAESGAFAGVLDYQIAPKSEGIGFDVYILCPLYVPLNDLLTRNGMTHLRAINLGIDLCDSILACREAGYLFTNIKPENIYLMPNGRFLLGDLGLVSLTDLDYASVPAEYIGPYSAPELSDIMCSPNLTVDLYSLGMVLYRVYNSNHGPFVDENTDEAMADKLRLTGKPLPTPIYADYELASIITKACAFRIENRFMSPEALKEALMLYMQRNEISDTLIVPPLIADPEPVKEEEEEDALSEEPLRMVEAEDLDEAFRLSFAPDVSGAGKEKAPELSFSIAEDVQVPTAAPEPEAKEDAPIVIHGFDAKPSSRKQGKGKSSRDSGHGPESKKASAPKVEAPEEAAQAAAPKESPTEAGKTDAPKAAEKADAPKEAAQAAGKMPQGNLKMKRKKHSSRGSSKERSEPPAVQIPSVPSVLETVTFDFSETHQSEEQVEEKVRKQDIAPKPEEETKSPSLDVFEAPKFELTDKDQLDIDDLIASVNAVVGDSDSKSRSNQADSGADGSLTMHVAPIEPTYSYSDSKHSERSEPDSEEKKRKSSKWLPLSIICLLLLGIIAVGAYLLSNYYVNVTELKIIDYSTTDLEVELISPDGQECFIVTCTDNYGNSYPRTIEGSRYLFTGLREKTAYTVSVYPSEYHRLRSGKSYTMTVTTPGSTEIKEFTAKRGAAAGEVLLNIVHEGPTPAEWSITYTDENGTQSGPFTFTNNVYVVSGLQEGSSYTFTINASENLYLSGQQTVEYTLLPVVNVESMQVNDVSGSSVSISWTCGENVPEEWQVTCEGGDYSQSLTTEKAEAVFTDLPDFARDYVFRISAAGMQEEAVLELPANPIILEDLTASCSDDGSVTVSWNTPAGSPANGWHLFYSPIGSFEVPYVHSISAEEAQADSVVLEDLIPGTEYMITLHLTAEDAASPLFGQATTNLTTKEAEVFTGFEISPTPLYDVDSSNVSLWELPEKEDWNYNDLTNLRTSFTKDERIVVCLQVESIVASEETVKLLYVIRGDHGQVVTSEAAEMTWDSMWFDRRHANEIPLPIEEGSTTATPGTYTLEIYINNQILLKRNFTIA